jgi:hypothetical protein
MGETFRSACKFENRIKKFLVFFFYAILKLALKNKNREAEHVQIMLIYASMWVDV